MLKPEDQVREQIVRYLAIHKLNRDQFAINLGYSKGQIDKILTGKAKLTIKFLNVLEARTGIVLNNSQRLNSKASATLEKEITDLLGIWQTVRPSFREKNALNCFLTEVNWSDDDKTIRFREKGNMLSPNNCGIVTVPRQSSNIFFLSQNDGRFRLAIMADAHTTDTLYGGILTVGSDKMANRAATSSPIVMKKLCPNTEGIQGLLFPSDEMFAELSALVSYTLSEGFFRAISTNTSIPVLP
jgi:transcriptional regulator with XRE-family HTH domain